MHGQPHIREYILAIKDRNGGPITYSTDKTDSLNSYYASVFGCERNTAQIKETESGEPCSTNIKMIRKRLAAIGRNKLVGPNGIPGEILTLDREAMIPYLALLLDIIINNSTTPSIFSLT